MLSPERSLPPGKTERHQTYNADFDSAKYAVLYSEKQKLTPEEYLQKKSMLNGETMFNQKTWLGERFNAGLSSRKDRLIEGKLYSTFSDEPLLTIYERGRDYRFDKSSKHDRMREEAEIYGFLQIQGVLGSTETPIDTMMLSISPSGGDESDYKHNFYDVFTLREENGERFVESSRFSSALTSGEYVDIASVLDPEYTAKLESYHNPLDVHFLANPIIISPDTGISSPEQLHATLHKEHRTLSQEGLEYIFKGCDALFLAYVSLLEENPWDSKGRNELLNTILNKADHLEAQFHRQEAVWGDTYTTIYQRDTGKSVVDDKRRWAHQQVREVSTGCGFSGGFSVGQTASFGLGGARFEGPSSPFSVFDFGGDTDKYGKRSFYCSNHHLNIRPYNTLIPKCQMSYCEAVVTC